MINNKKTISILLIIIFLFQITKSDFNISAAVGGLPRYNTAVQMESEITALSSGNMSSTATLSQAGPWYAQYKEVGQQSWSNMTKYKFENTTASEWMRMCYVAYGGTSEPMFNVNYKDYDTAKPKVVTALLRSDYTTDLALSYTITSRARYRLEASSDVPAIWISEATDPRMNVTVKIMVGGTVKWTSPVLRTQGSSVTFPQIDFNAAVNDVVKIVIERTPDSGAPATITNLSFKPVLKNIGNPIYRVQEQMENEISALSSGGMTSAASFTQSGPWYSQYKEVGQQTWSGMAKYKYENDINSPWMRMCHVAYGGTSEPMFNVNYKDYDTAKPKVVTALLRSDYTTDLALSYTVANSGTYRLEGSSDVPDIWISEATDPRMDVVVKIMVGSTVKWTSAVLRTQGSSVSFPQTDFDAVQGDVVRIVIERTPDSGAPATITQLSFKPVLEQLVTSHPDNIFYVDATGGSDTNSGTAEYSAWKTLGKVNSRTYQPGDTILFKAGENWTGQLMPQGSGTDGSPIVIDSYGDGAKPAIDAGGTTSNDGAVIRFYNQQYWEINNLDLMNDAASGSTRNGILVLGKDSGVLNHFYIRNCNIHDIQSVNSYVEVYMGDNPIFSNPVFGDNIVNSHYANFGGIVFRSLKGASNVPSAYNDIVVEDNTIQNITGAVGVGICSEWASEWADNSSNPIWGDRLDTKNVAIRNNNILTPGYGGVNIASVDGRTGNGVVVEYNTVSAAGTDGNTAALWPYLSYKSVFQYNEVYDTQYHGGDCEAFDFDGMNDGAIVQYNYSHDNAGGALVACYDGGVEDLTEPASYTRNCIYRYNISQNDHATGRAKVNVTSGVESLYVYNNVFYAGAGETSTNQMVAVAGGAININFYNNVFYTVNNNDSYSLLGQNTVFNNNCFYGGHPATEPYDPNKITADPQFVNPGTGTTGMATVDGYKLQSTSPLINVGKQVVDNGGRDFWGAGIDSRQDIGVSEYSLVKNPGFDDGRTEGTTISNWTNHIDSGSSGSAYIEKGGYTGGYQLTQKSATAYTVRTVQTATNIANGTYEFKAYVKSSGGQNTAKITLSGYGGSDVDVTIPQTDNWVMITAKNLNLTTGSCTITIKSDAAADKWIKVDSVQLSIQQAGIVLNKGFEENALNGGSGSGWTNTGSSSVSADSTARTGTAYGRHYSATSYTANTSQAITGLTNGLYKFSAYVKSSGGQTSAYLYANNFGGAQLNANITATGDWKKIEVTGINVTNGTCTIGFSSGANAGNWINFDDAELIQITDPNYLIKNPGFENGGTLYAPSNWTIDIGSGTNAFTLVTAAGRSGSYYGSIKKTTSFEAKVSQTMTNIPTGTYTAKIWIKSNKLSSGISKFGVSDYGGADTSTTFTNTTTWTQYAIKNIMVTNGQCKFYVHAKGGNGNYLYFDDVEFLPQEQFGGRAVNYDFEEGGQTTGSITGWTVSGTANAVQTSGSAGAARRRLYGQHSYISSAYTADTYQTITGLTNGLYTMEAYVKSSGGHTSAYLYAKNFGGTQVQVNIPQSATWTKIKLENINVTTNKADIGVYTDSPANKWVQFDAIEFYLKPVIVDPSFEDASKFKATSGAGWYCWSTTSPMADGVYREQGSAHSGSYYSVFKYSANIEASLYQMFSGIPNGFYTMTAWVKSGGTERTDGLTQLSAKESGTYTKVRTFGAYTNWTKVTLANISVMDENVTCLSLAQLAANEWLFVDDVDLVRNDRYFTDYTGNVEVNNNTVYASTIVNFDTYTVTVQSPLSKITNVSPNTTVDQFKSKITPLNSSMNFKNNLGNTLIDTENVGSGTTIDFVTEKGDTFSYSIILYGDTTGDGIIDILDLIAVKRDVLKIEMLSGDLFIAGDIYGKGKISILSLIGIKKHLLNISIIDQHYKY